MVIGSMFAFAALGYALNTQRFSRTNQDWNGALAAAQAGVDDYIAYLNRNDNYARTPVDCTNIAIKGPKTGTNTCGYTAATPVAWKNINPANPAAGQFHYDIDAAKLESDGIVQVTSTGKVGTKTRSLQVGVGRGGSTDFLYYTDHEDADPDNAQAYAPNTDGSSSMNAKCAWYWWDAPNDRKTESSAGCREITFIGGDVLDGPAHLNDTPLLTDAGGVKPRFSLGSRRAIPSASWPSLARRAPTRTVTARPTAPTTPAAGRSMRTRWTCRTTATSSRTSRAASTAAPTRIKFLGDGTMRVWSKESTRFP